MRVLAVNSGSVSLKVSLHEVTAGTARQLGTWHAALTDGAYAQAFDRIAHQIGDDVLGTVDAAGHRIVNGGVHTQPMAIDPAVRAAIVDAEALAPLHNHAAIEALDAARERLPALPMVAVFDTGFHASMPDVAARYALGAAVTGSEIRRYGYHGIAHQSMLEQYARATGRQPGECSVITLQLGGGCSACAVRDGRSVDTSMGFTPLEGLMMATRSGSIDPAIVTYLQRTRGLSPDQVDALLNERSGLLGVSALSGNVVDLLRAEAQGNAAAALALEMFCYRVRQCIGAYMAVIDARAVVFGGGIGEHSAVVRRRIIEPMAHLRLSLDARANERANGLAARIDAGSAIEVWVVDTDEASIIARETAKVIEAH